MQVALDGSVRAADKIAFLKSVFDLGKDAEDDLERRLKSIEESVFKSLQQLAENGGAHTVRSNKRTDHYFRAQIIENQRTIKAIFAAFRHFGIL